MVRFGPWTGETQLPVPVFVEDDHRRETATPAAHLQQAPTAASAAEIPAHNIRRHLTRATLRVGALTLTDVIAVGVAVAAMRAADVVLVGPASMSASARVLDWPRGDWAFAFALVVGLATMGTYGSGDRRRDAARLFAGCALAVCIAAWRSIWEAPLTVWVEVVVMLLSVAAAVVVSRHVVDRLVHRHRDRTRTSARTVLVGREGPCVRIYTQRLVTRENGFDLVGFVDTDPARTSASALGGIADLEQLLQLHDVDTVVVCGDLDELCLKRVVRAATVGECELLALAPTLEAAGVHPTIVWRHGRPLVALRAEATRGSGLLLKRTFDVVTSVTLLVLLSPLLAALALAVRLDSPGPVVFGHLRAGRYGRYFRCLKFRSMYRDAEQRLMADPELYQRYVENDYKLPADEDPRITPVGRWLRRTSLDELPQLINVIRGEMSLVGPRPVIREELNQYADDQPLLLSLRPGVTGLWQVNGRSTVPYPARMYIELEYVQTWTLMRDIEILLRTVPSVLKQRGAG